MGYRTTYLGTSSELQQFLKRHVAPTLTLALEHPVSNLDRHSPLNIWNDILGSFTQFPSSTLNVSSHPVVS